MEETLKTAKWNESRAGAVRGCSVGSVTSELSEVVFSDPDIETRRRSLAKKKSGKKRLQESKDSDESEAGAALPKHAPKHAKPRAKEKAKLLCRFEEILSG